MSRKITIIGISVGLIVGFLIGFLSGLYMEVTYGYVGWFGIWGDVFPGVFLGAFFGAIVSVIINNFLRIKKKPKDIGSYRNIIIIGMILGIIFIPWWSLILYHVLLFGARFDNLLYLTFPVIISIGFIIYGIKMILKQKKIIT